ncbi:MAG TPA: ribosomal protein S18-alanine N-acetyltransferase [Haliangiales bacterium]|nr:ribosomal protein S18-alanine N-acetyltransferase [Haliangiales bacterium]
MATHPRPRRLEIVPMRPPDLDEIMEIERLSYKHPWARQVFIEELDREWAHVDVLRERTDKRSRVIGFINYWLVRDEVHVLNVSVHPDDRRKGHASRLIAHVVEYARRRSSRFVTLEVRRGNHGALKLYRSFGFRSVGIRPNYYAEEGEDAIVMLLDL